jgi:hypothetical protein
MTKRCPLGRWFCPYCGAWLWMNFYASSVTDYYATGSIGKFLDCYCC